MDLERSADATANEVFADTTALFYGLQLQLRGNVKRTDKITMVTSPLADIAGLTTNNFNVQVMELVKRGFPNLTWKTAVEYTTPAGELVQMIVDEIEGQRTAEPCFAEKMRSHPVIPNLSSFKQKVSGGTWGLIMFRPLAVKQMIGV